MKIDSYTIGMESQHSYVEDYFKQESLSVTGNVPSSSQQGVLSGILQSRDILELSDKALSLLSGKTFIRESQTNQPLELEVKLSSKDEQRIQLLQKMVEKLTGKRIRFLIPERIRLFNNGATQLIVKGKTLNINLQQIRPQWGIRYDSFESYHESESLNFQSSGVVRTADGKEINFHVELNMSREFALQNQVHFRAGSAAVDPLVINFGNNAPSLTSTKYFFDLDCDGDMEQISFVGEGSGFLSLDLNGDGKINNGKELFGPNTGNGFSELDDYDSDGNNWIDENDPIFEKLRIWTKDAQGNDVLCALGAKGVGAIFLGNIKTDYQMKDQTNQLHGEVAASGIYLMENGTAGTIQQIDLVV